MYCIKCGNIVNDGELVCRYCGTPTGNTSPGPKIKSTFKGSLAQTSSMAKAESDALKINAEDSVPSTMPYEKTESYFEPVAAPSAYDRGYKTPSDASAPHYGASVPLSKVPYGGHPSSGPMGGASYGGYPVAPVVPYGGYSAPAAPVAKKRSPGYWIARAIFAVILMSCIYFLPTLTGLGGGAMPDNYYKSWELAELMIDAMEYVDGMYVFMYFTLLFLFMAMCIIFIAACTNVKALNMVFSILSLVAITLFFFSWFVIAMDSGASPGEFFSRIFDFERTPVGMGLWVAFPLLIVNCVLAGKN